MKQNTEISKEIENYLDTIRFLNESTDDYFFIWDICKARLYFAGEIYKKYPLPFREKDGNSLEEWKSIVYQGDLEAFEDYLALFERGEEEFYHAEYRIIDKNGNKEWVSCKGKSSLDENGCPKFMIGRISGSDLIRKADTLTGLLNEDKFMEDMQMCMNKGRSGHLLLLGIDNFKHINIKYGRNFGNDVLKKVAELLEGYTDVPMGVYRLDGDRFAVMLPGQSKEYVENLYGDIQKKLKKYCTVSAGVVYCAGDNSKDCNMMYQYAEDALDRAKKLGKNKMEFFSHDYYKKRLDTLSLQDEMSQSVEDNCKGFYLCYQPLINSQNFAVQGAEALLRYDSPSRGTIGPVEFIPLLEQTELICPVGEWVLRKALMQCRRWRKSIPDFHINVNISYVQLRTEGICRRVLEILEETGLPGEAVTLEVTESMQLQDYQYFNRIFGKWKKAGIKIAIDDFGTGYSSLGYLKSLDIDVIKIDRCFVTAVQQNAYNYRLLRNVTELAHSARIMVCCEGVETEGELMALKEMNPETLQGYLFSKPCFRETFEKSYIREDCPEYQEQMKREEYFRGLDYGEDKRFLEILRQEELGTIVEGMDDVIYVSDIDTYELYYLNPSGRKLTGLYGYKGCKCYKVLFDRETPCEFCTKSRQEETDFHVREVENKFLNRHLVIKDKIMPWQGGMVRLGIATDVTTREIASRKVKETLDFEKIIVKCSRMLVDEGDMQNAILNVLGSIGEFYQADRTYVFESEQGGGYWRNTYEWCAQGVSSQKENLQKIPTKAIAHWMKVFKEGSSVLVPDVDSLKVSFPEIWEELDGENIRRLIAAPIWKEQRLIGFVGVDNPKHRWEEDALTSTMACFLGDRISREATKKRLNELLDCRYEDILKNTNMGLWVIHIDEKNNKYELYTDKTMRRILGIKGNPGPEKCYRHWYDRISEECCSYVDRGVTAMIESRKVVRLEYQWNHPKEGKISIRCVGVRGENSEGKICLEGYHSAIKENEQFK